MLDNSYSEKCTEITRLQKEIRRCRVKLFSMAMLVVVPLLVVLTGIIAFESHASDSSGESGWFLSGLSTESTLLVMTIWTVPLLLIIKANRDQMDADRHSLFELQQEFSEGPF